MTHFVFHPLASIDVPGVGKAGPTENMKGEKMLDKMMAKCTAVSVDSAGKKYIDGACALTDHDGDIVFSTFDTRDLDKSQPKMDCGTHIITGDTGKYAGIMPGAIRPHSEADTVGRARRIVRDRHPSQHDLGDQVG